ncbi:MAG: metallophosphoesterase [Gemmatimonadaceae bacterium]
MRRLLACAALAATTVLCGVAPLPAQGATITGTVFVDANGNGVRDAGERGLANVPVSNQNEVVLTDANGAYRLPAGTTGVTFVSVPDGYRAVGSFWHGVNTVPATGDFALAPTPRTTTFTFIHASDTHIAPAVLARTQRFRAMADSIAPAFVIITGDLVRDALRVGEAEAVGYYEMFGREAAQFHVPVWTIPGNHENFGIERGQSKVAETNPLYGRKMYHHYRGPDYYSFTYGGVHFVGLNSVDIDDQWYYGHVDSLQLAWLERDLALVPASMPVVTFNHIPFFSSFDGVSGYREDPPAPTLITVHGKTQFRHTVANAGDVLAVLRKHRHVLALGGHLHAGEHIEYDIDGLKTSFNNVAAIVGPSFAAGLQFESGFEVYTVRNGVIESGRFIPLGMDARK